MISSCTTYKADDHSYVNIYQHNADRSQTELATQNTQKYNYRKSQVTEERGEFPVGNTNNAPARRFSPMDYSAVDEPYIYNPKPTSYAPQEEHNKTLIMPDYLGRAYYRATGNSYIPEETAGGVSLPKPPFYAVAGTDKKVYISPSDMQRMLDGAKIAFNP